MSTTDGPTPLGDRLSELGEKLRLRPDDPPVTMPAELEAEFSAIDRELDDRELEQRRERWAAKTPARFREARLDALDDELRTELETWLLTEPHPNLWLVGPVGVGKTHAAVAVLRELYVVQRVTDVRRWFVGSLLDRLDWRNPDNAETMSRARSASVLVLDDLGVGELSEWAVGRIGSLVNERYERTLPTIVTTNREPGVLREVVGERTYSRLAEGATVLEVGGDDRRLA